MKKGNRWEDHYTRRAREEKWLARSVYKLEEIDRKFKLILPGYRILDLGCFPGSWSQYGVKHVGSEGEVIGVDLNHPDKVLAPNFRFIQADVLKLDLFWLLKEVGPVDVVMSDLAPRTSGIRISDNSRSIELAGKALEIALIMLKKGGHFLNKVFEGNDLKGLKVDVSNVFEQMRLIRPAAVRKKSREIYLIGIKMVKC